MNIVTCCSYNYQPLVKRLTKTLRDYGWGELYIVPCEEKLDSRLVKTTIGLRDLPFPDDEPILFLDADCYAFQAPPVLEAIPHGTLGVVQYESGWVTSCCMLFPNKTTYFDLCTHWQANYEKGQPDEPSLNHIIKKHDWELKRIGKDGHQPIPGIRHIYANCRIHKR